MYSSIVVLRVLVVLTASHTVRYTCYESLLSFSLLDIVAQAAAAVKGMIHASARYSMLGGCENTSSVTSIPSSVR